MDANTGSLSLVPITRVEVRRTAPHDLLSILVSTLLAPSEGSNPKDHNLAFKPPSRYQSRKPVHDRIDRCRNMTLTTTWGFQSPANSRLH